MFVIDHALSCTQLVFWHATETQLGLKWQKLAVYIEWPWISNSDYQEGPELRTFGSRVQRSFQPADTRRPTEQSHSSSVVFVMTELQQCSAVWRNMNAKKQSKTRNTVKLAMVTVKSVKLCNTVFTVKVLAALSCNPGQNVWDTVPFSRIAAIFARSPLPPPPPPPRCNVGRLFGKPFLTNNIAWGEGGR